MSDFLIRKAEISDAEELSDLIKESMTTYCEDSRIKSNRLESMTESVESIAYRIKNSDGLCLVKDGSILGTITLSVTDNPLKYSFSEKSEKALEKYDRIGYISRFAVKNTLRKTGLGVTLMNEALTLAGEYGLKGVVLHTAVENKSMAEFYGNRGFRLIDAERSRGYLRGLWGIDITKA